MTPEASLLDWIEAPYVLAIIVNNVIWLRYSLTQSKQFHQTIETLSRRERRDGSDH